MSAIIWVSLIKRVPCPKADAHFMLPHTWKCNFPWQQSVVDVSYFTTYLAYLLVFFTLCLYVVKNDCANMWKPVLLYNLFNILLYILIMCWNVNKISFRKYFAASYTLDLFYWMERALLFTIASAGAILCTYYFNQCRI